MLRDKLLIKNVFQMAHDIRSPLFALQAILQTPGEFNEDKKILLLKATKRLTEIANTIIEEYQKPTQTDIAALIQEIVAEKQFTYPNFKFEYYGFEKIFFKLNPTELKRIISNLVNNSIEAYAEDTGEIHISLAQANGMVQITIRDYGKGVPLSLIPKIFGQGLGLSHAKSYIESIGGKIDLTSSILGTEVVLTFE